MNIIEARATVTRPADTTAYAVSDLLAGSTTAASVVPLIFNAQTRGLLNRVRIHKSGAVLTNAQFRLHLFAANPGAPSVGDNGAFVASSVLAVPVCSNYLGFVDVTIDTAAAAGSVGIGAPSTAIALPYGELFGYIEVRAAYTPASAEVFTVTAFVAD